MTDLALVQHLAQHYYGQAPQDLHLISHSPPAQTSVWRFQIADQPKVMKLGHQPQHPGILKEIELFDHLRPHPIPLPQVEHVHLGTTVSDRPAFIMASAGEQTLLQRLTTPNRPTFDGFIAMGRILAQIHTIAVSAPGQIVTGGIAPHQPQTYWQNALQYADWAVAQDYLTAADVEVLATVPPPDFAGTTLCHQDYHPGQCIVAADQVTAVVDWQQAWAGNPWVDLAIAHAYLDFYCPPALIKCFFMGYTALRSLPADYHTRSLSMRMVQALGLLHRYHQQGQPAWGDRACQQYRAYVQRYLKSAVI